MVSTIGDFSLAQAFTPGDRIAKKSSISFKAPQGRNPRLTLASIRPLKGPGRKRRFYFPLFPRRERLG